MGKLEDTETVTLVEWIEALDEILEEERQAADEARKR